MEAVKKVTSPSVKEIFNNMEYGPAPESDKIAQSWLEVEILDDWTRMNELSMINPVWL